MVHQGRDSSEIPPKYTLLVRNYNSFDIREWICLWARNSSCLVFCGSRIQVHLSRRWNLYLYRFQVYIHVFTHLSQLWLGQHSQWSSRQKKNIANLLTMTSRIYRTAMSRDPRNRICCSARSQRARCRWLLLAARSGQVCFSALESPLPRVGQRRYWSPMLSWVLLCLRLCWLWERWRRLYPLLEVFVLLQGELS